MCFNLHRCSYRGCLSRHIKCLQTPIISSRAISSHLQVLPPFLLTGLFPLPQTPTSSFFCLPQPSLSCSLRLRRSINTCLSLWLVMLKALHLQADNKNRFLSFCFNQLLIGERITCPVGFPVFFFGESLHLHSFCFVLLVLHASQDVVGPRVRFCAPLGSCPVSQLCIIITLRTTFLL